MTSRNDKIAKKSLKSQVKTVKAEVKNATVLGAKRPAGIPEGVGVRIIKTEHGTDLVVSGLNDDQLQRLLPQVNKEVLITLTQDRNTLRAGMMRFVREGVFQTIIKVIAGLIVGYMLLKLGMA